MTRVVVVGSRVTEQGVVVGRAEGPFEGLGIEALPIGYGVGSGRGTALLGD